MERTELNQLGEFGLIDRIKGNVTTVNKETVVGIGDDAAVVALDSELQLISTDMLVEGIHFDLSYTPLKHLGYKAVAVNVSDIAAMNGTPKQITVSIAVSNRISLEAIDELYSGIRTACEAYNVDVVGGDTTSSTSGLIISISVLGISTKETVAKRDGAKVGDIVCVTGDLGAAYLGLQVLEREKQVYMANPEMQPDIKNYDYLVSRILKPEARMDIVHELKEAGVVPTSMIDISDGLASEVLHLATKSNVGIHVMEENLPIESITFDTALEFQMTPTICALNGGEDYELLMTMSREDYESKGKKIAEITAIGEVRSEADGVSLISKQGNVYPIEAQGWNHFKGKK